MDVWLVHSLFAHFELFVILKHLSLNFYHAQQIHTAESCLFVCFEWI